MTIKKGRAAIKFIENRQFVLSVRVSNYTSHSKQNINCSQCITCCLFFPMHTLTAYSIRQWMQDNTSTSDKYSALMKMTTLIDAENTLTVSRYFNTFYRFVFRLYFCLHHHSFSVLFTPVLFTR